METSHRTRTLTPSKLGSIYGKLLKMKKPKFPNMPKHQPCPSCHRSCKVEEKLLGGANYRCSLHGKFFIRKGGIEDVPNITK